MDDASLIQRLGRFEPPPGRDALERAREAARERVAMRASGPRSNQRPAGSGRRLAAGLAAAIVAILTAAALFTPPGQAFTSWVGERLGFGGPGEPGGPPALRQLNEAWSEATDLEGQPQYVLIVGPVTGRERSRYEFVTYRLRPRPDRPGWMRAPCFKLDLTQVRSMTSQGCGVLPKNGQFAFSGTGGGYGHAFRDEDGNLRFSDELFHVTGRVGPEVTAVEATVNGHEIPVQVRPVPADLRERFGLGGPFSFFIGFYSGVAHGGTLEVTARGPRGERLGHAKTELIDLVEAQRFSCRQILESEGPIPRRGRRECEEVLGRPGGKASPGHRP